MMTHLFDGERAWQHVLELAERIGPRFPGSESEKQASAYLGQYFTGLGLAVRQERFRVLTYEILTHGLELLAPETREIECQPMGFSASTGPRGVEGEVLLFERGRTTGLEGLRGKILLVAGGLGEKDWPAVLPRQPLGLIIAETALGPSPHTHYTPEKRERTGMLPTVRVSYEDGLFLAKQAGARARLTLQINEGKRISQNVIAEVPGTDVAGEVVVVCGHYCSTFGIPAATDNAGGAAVMMELARVFRKRGSRRTLRFIGFGAEEIDCRGSIFHAQQLRQNDAERNRIRLCLNFDGQGAVLGQNMIYAVGEPELAASLRTLAAERDFPAEVEGRGYGDDLQFARLGIPAVGLYRRGYFPLHTALDNPDQMSPEVLARFGAFAEAWLARHVAEPDRFPFPRSVPPELMQKCQAVFTSQMETMLEPVAD